MTSIGVQHPSIPQLSGEDEIQTRYALRRNRLLATGLLALMIVTAIATHLAPSSGWLVHLVRAGAEAGIILGLADWFAITVLFRHPFGIPLPHTAILPSNKDRIGRALGSFVERNFLIPEVILPKLHQADFTQKIAGWLALPEKAPMVADWVMTLLNRLLAAGHSAQISELFQHTVKVDWWGTTRPSSGNRAFDEYRADTAEQARGRAARVSGLLAATALCQGQGRVRPVHGRAAQSSSR
jgi:hypothetical protein